MSKSRARAEKLRTVEDMPRFSRVAHPAVSGCLD
jgi:hypothetical protein